MNTVFQLIYSIFSFARVGIDKFIQKTSDIFNGEYLEVIRITRTEPIIFWDLVQYFFNEPTLIVDFIYIGSAYNASDWYTLDNINIKTVINVSDELTNYFEDHIEYLRIPILDNNQAQFGENFEKAYQFLIQKTSNQPILVHCYMGSSRSVSIVLYYLMKKHKMRLDNAIEFIKNIRPIVNLNSSFYEELKEQERILFDD